MPLPTGMVRDVRTRSSIEFYAEGWPEGVGPTAGIAKRNPSGRKPGRPAGGELVIRAEPSEKRRLSLKTPRDHLLRDRMLNALAMIVLRSVTARYETRGESLEGSIKAAMIDLNWPKRSAAEIDRIRTRFRRAQR